MGRKYKRLFEKIVEPENFELAYKKTLKGKRSSCGYLEFKEYDALNLERVRQEVADGSYKIGRYNHFEIYDPKHRLISALPFRDRIVQHALNNLIEPIFDRVMLPYTFACRPNKGTHAGVVYLQSRMRKTGATHFLKTDFSKYFPSINRALLHTEFERKIKCQRTLDLLACMIPRTGTGLHIGSLSSQLGANLFGHIFDRFMHYTLRPVTWVRYMDDIVMLGNCPHWLRDAKYRLESLADDCGMRFSKWHVHPVSRGVNYLGYRIWPRYKLIRKDSVGRAKRKLRHLRKTEQTDALARFAAAWKGHISWADSHNLCKTLELEHV